MPISELLSRRRSVRTFADRPVPSPALEALLEAVRWAPSNGNRQPWWWVVRMSDTSKSEMGPCLSRGNQWALKAPVLITVVTRVADSGTSNNIPYAFFDCGLATMALIVQAEDLGLRVHPMAGWIREPLVKLLRIPDGYDPVVVLAVGYEGDLASLDPELQARELRPRVRKSADMLWNVDNWKEKWTAPPPEPKTPKS